jgi:hypothetical protein
LKNWAAEKKNSIRHRSEKILWIYFSFMVVVVSGSIFRLKAFQNEKLSTIEFFSVLFYLLLSTLELSD